MRKNLARRVAVVIAIVWVTASALTLPVRPSMAALGSHAHLATPLTRRSVAPIRRTVTPTPTVQAVTATPTGAVISPTFIKRILTATPAARPMPRPKVTRVVVRPRPHAKRYRLPPGRVSSFDRHDGKHHNSTRMISSAARARMPTAYPTPPIAARAAFLEDARTGQVLFVQNADTRLPMASTTKIMTAILALQYGHLNQLVTVSATAASIGQSTMGLVQGEQVTVRQLLYGLMLNSGNDAAIALAEHSGGSVAHFVAMMNSMAARLGLTNTHYVTPHGLDAYGHYTSARDLAHLAAYAMQNPIFRRIVATESYHVPATRHNREHWLANINKVMYWYPGINGVKPGNTDAAGLCQVVSVHRDGRDLIAVLLNTPTLWVDIRNLLNYGLQDFRWEQAPVWGDGPANIIRGGVGDGQWEYLLGAGHYIRGAFLHYFLTHGGLKTLGYPRTEPVSVNGQTVQYFQGGALIADPAHHSVYPAALGDQLSTTAGVYRGGVAAPFSAAYRAYGGPGVLGDPVTPLVFVEGREVQIYQYGELTLLGGKGYLVPLGDIALEQRGWLPSRLTRTAYPATMTTTFLPATSAPSAR